MFEFGGTSVVAVTAAFSQRIEKFARDPHLGRRPCLSSSANTADRR
jgi:hypothetical protein